MKKIINLLVFILCCFYMNAQCVLHNYVQVAVDKPITMEDILSSDKMRLLRASYSSPNEKHYWFGQLQDGIIVEGAELIIHTDSLDVIRGTSGHFVDFEEIEFGSKLQSKLSVVVNEIDTIRLNGIIKDLDSNYTRISSPEYVFTRLKDNLSVDIKNLVKTIKVSIGRDDFTEKTIYFDVADYSVLKETASKRDYSNIPVEFNSLYNGQKQITVDDSIAYAGNTNQRQDYYILRSDNNGRNIQAYISNGTTAKTTDLNLLNRGELQVAASAYWAVLTAYEYFYYKHNRRGMDGSNKCLEVRVNHGDKNNSSYTKDGGKSCNLGSDLISFGSGDGIMTNSFAAIDVAGHEYTHGVIAYTSALVPSYESGALAEGICDIFGTIIEYNADNNRDNWWIIGDDVVKYTHNGFDRSLKDPKNYPNACTNGSPDTYEGEYWYKGEEDQGGIHINGSVLGRWFYLLAEGGSGINDKNVRYSVDRLDISIAARILYNSLFNIGSAATYKDMRLETVKWVMGYYGDCSRELEIVEEAWDAVGVPYMNPYESLSPKDICGILSGTKLIREGGGVRIGPNNCAVKVKSGSDIKIESRNEIYFLGEFEVELNATFEANIYNKCK